MKKNIILGLTVITFTLGLGSTTVLAQESVQSRLDRLERSFQARQEGQASLLEAVTRLQHEVSELRGMVEEHSYQLEQILDRQRDLYQELERRSFQPGAQGEGASSEHISSSSTEPVGQVSQESGYDRAIRLVLEERRYEEAIVEFQAFNEANPDSPYLSNSYYWLGQLFYAQNDFDAAVKHFNRVAKEYYDSSKRPDSLLKLGMIALKRELPSEAKAFFEQVIEEYPQSSEANLARKELGSL